jgi:hypothetical protein
MESDVTCIILNSTENKREMKINKLAICVCVCRGDCGNLNVCFAMHFLYQVRVNGLLTQVSLNTWLSRGDATIVSRLLSLWRLLSLGTGGS